MASSSNSEFKYSYDIFLSFRGLDTRNKFTDHLYEALKREGFETFRDNEGIERGENINSELQKAIWNSSMSVIVLSKTYATSKSCLFEIQTILEHHKKKSDHVIFPVFYEVEPSEIKEQAKNLDFRGKKVTDEEVKGWSAALKEVAKMGNGKTCGCSAPVGGVLFALEEVTSWWRSQLMWRVFFTSAIVAVVVPTAMGWCKSGKCGHFGSGGFIIWDISGGQEDYSFEEL